MWRIKTSVGCGRLVMLLANISVLLPNYLHAANDTHSDRLFAHIFDGYNSHLIPILNPGEIVQINITFNMLTMNNFDERTGIMEMTATLELNWIEPRMVWNASDYGGLESMLVPISLLWYPKLLFLQSSEKLKEVGDNAVFPRVYHDGSVRWYPGVVIKVVCSVDVTNFPFDSQTCSLTLSAWHHLKSELKLFAKSNVARGPYYNPNSQWIFESSLVTADWPVAMFLPPSMLIELTFVRRAMFFVIYNIIPVTLLGLINNLVFVMPNSSGERMSVAITAFLSFIVFMEMTNRSVPESSSPVAYINFYFLFLISYSSAILFLCIVSLVLHNKDGCPGSIVGAIIRHFCFCKRKRSRIRTESQVPMFDNSSNAKGMQSANPMTVVDIDKNNDQTFAAKDIVLPDDAQTIKEQNQAEGKPVTWQLIANTYDKCCLVFNYIVFGSVTIGMYMHIASQQ